MKYKPPQPQSYSAETAALITQLKDRIKRLEEAGDEMAVYDLIPEQLAERWIAAKEAKL